MVKVLLTDGQGLIETIEDRLMWRVRPQKASSLWAGFLYGWIST